MRRAAGAAVALWLCAALLGCQAAAPTPSPSPSPSGEPTPTPSPSLTSSPTPGDTTAPSTATPAATPVPSNDPATIGRWELIATDSPISPIHAALLHTGRVWFGTGSNNEEAHEVGDFRSGTWDPSTDAFNEVETPWDVFCAGHSFLADGRLFLAGGTIGYPTEEAFFKGSKRAYLFDPVAEQYSRVDDMGVGRWYPTTVTLPTGRVYVVGGFDETGISQATVPEIFDPDSETWVEAPGDDAWPLYPALFVTMQRGLLFYSGGNVFGNKGVAAGLLDIVSGDLTAVGGPSEPDQRDQSASVLLPPAQDQRVMIIGGGSPLPPVGLGLGIANVDIIDLDDAAPAYTAGPAMSSARMHVSAVLLPDRTVLASGGGRVREGDPVHEAEIYDPTANSWRTVAESHVDRLYHSFALLLPDGRVLVGGSNPGSFHEHRLEVYSPPYLFRGPRPVISDAPEAGDYGEQINVTVDVAEQIASVSLIRPAAVTHSMDTEQRVVDVPFTAQAGGLDLHLPDDPTLAPPGWYMLFVVDGDGVPNEAAWIKLG